MAARRLVGGAAARGGAAAWKDGGGGGPGRWLGLRKQVRQGSIRYLIPSKFGRKQLCASIILIDRALGPYIGTRAARSQPYLLYKERIGRYR